MTNIWCVYIENQLLENILLNNVQLQAFHIRLRNVFLLRPVAQWLGKLKQLCNDATPPALCNIFVWYICCSFQVSFEWKVKVQVTQGLFKLKLSKMYATLQALESIPFKKTWIWKIVTILGAKLQKYNIINCSSKGHQQHYSSENVERSNFQLFEVFSGRPCPKFAENYRELKLPKIRKVGNITRQEKCRGMHYCS